ncbi:hypothetical protein K438DRAFT_2028111 [Mycena galopus ATCC 62051]|nr:hypothetical protein K438DRAFT_2028111 [Mycena galopus ATCC 62051]
MSSAIPHVVAFLTRPLLSSGAIAPTAVSSAQLILGASLASVPSATYTLTVATPPAPLLAASIGAGIPWAAWFASFATTEILLVYGPGFVKARLGAGQPVKDIWSEEQQGSVVPIAVSRVHAKVALSNTLDFTTGARLRAMLLSARVRGMRREREQSDAAAAMEPIAIRFPSLPALSSLSPSPLSNSLSALSDSDDSDSDYCDSDFSSSASSASSKFTSYSTDSLTSAGSAPTTPLKSSPKTALPVVSAGAYRHPFARSQEKATPRPAPAVPTPRAAARPTKTKPTVAVRPDPKKVDTTAYLYAGGVTRVMTGGVMLGARRSLTPNFFHRPPIHHSAVPHVVALPFSPGPTVHPPHRRLLLDASPVKSEWSEEDSETQGSVFKFPTYVSRAGLSDPLLRPDDFPTGSSASRRHNGRPHPVSAGLLVPPRRRSHPTPSLTALDLDDSDSPLRLRLGFFLLCLVRIHLLLHRLAHARVRRLRAQVYHTPQIQILPESDNAPRSERSRVLPPFTRSQAKATPCPAPTTAVPTPRAASRTTKTKPSALRVAAAPAVCPDPKKLDMTAYLCASGVTRRAAS